jgi:hypothetical protein
MVGGIARKHGASCVKGINKKSSSQSEARLSCA